MNPAVLFAVVAALAFGAWTLFHKEASTHIGSLLGAVLISLTAVVIGSVVLLFRKGEFTFQPKGILFAVLAGICALGIDFFVLRAYSSGISVSVAGPLIIGGGVAIAAILGFFLGESITLLKVLALLMVIAGSAILAALS